jgi:hypothetical protein
MYNKQYVIVSNILQLKFNCSNMELFKLQLLLSYSIFIFLFWSKSDNVLSVPLMFKILSVDSCHNPSTQTTRFKEISISLTLWFFSSLFYRFSRLFLFSFQFSWFLPSISFLYFISFLSWFVFLKLYICSVPLCLLKLSQRFSSFDWT